MPMPYRYLRCDLRSPGVTKRRNGPLGLRDDYDDEANVVCTAIVVPVGALQDVQRWSAPTGT